MENIKTTVDVLIVGAGICGLMAAQVLAKCGLSALILDKGRSVGGRLATRRIGEGLADHGAQFFTVRSPRLQEQVDRWLTNGVVYLWSNGFSDGNRSVEAFDGHPRYAVRGGMNALAKYAASELPKTVTILTNIKVTRLNSTNDGWHAIDENATIYQGKALLLTPPVPQSLSLLGNLVEQMAVDEADLMRKIDYAPCLAGLFVVDGVVKLPEPGALQRPDEAVSWVADNQRKGISPRETVITVHANGDLSKTLWDKSDSEGLGRLQKYVEPWLANDAHIREAQLKRWRYAQPTTLHPERFLISTSNPLVAFAGDAFGERE
ncbi:MAG: FAD-dependent oxidoreductase [Anaerolineae bacterium]